MRRDRLLATTVFVLLAAVACTSEQAGPERQQGAALPEPCTEVAGAAWRDRLVVVGGLDEAGEAVDRVDLYDRAADAWERGPDLPAARHHTAVAPLAGRVYVVGGYAIEGGEWVAKADVWSLGPGEAHWREEPRLASARGALAVVSAGEQLQAIGGVDGGRVLATTETFRPGASRWESGPSLATPREHLAATAAGDEVFAIAGRVGGFDRNHASVEVLRGGRWEDAGALVEARSGIDAATVDDAPCVAGGEEPGRTIPTVECLVDDEWQVVDELEVARHGLAVAEGDGALHVIGGGTEPGLSVSDTHEVIPLALD